MGCFLKMYINPSSLPSVSLNEHLPPCNLITCFILLEALSPACGWLVMISGSPDSTHGGLAVSVGPLSPRVWPPIPPRAPAWAPVRVPRPQWWWWGCRARQWIPIISFLFLWSEFPIMKKRAKNNSHAFGADAVSHLSLLLSRCVSELSWRRTRLPGPAAAPSSGSGTLRMRFLLAGEWAEAESCGPWGHSDRVSDGGG